LKVVLNTLTLTLTLPKALFSSINTNNKNNTVTIRGRHVREIRIVFYFLLTKDLL
jgi:hypothetical protein